MIPKTMPDQDSHRYTPEELYHLGAQHLYHKTHDPTLKTTQRIRYCRQALDLAKKAHNVFLQAQISSHLSNLSSPPRD